jgi:hypothetical protein
VLSALCVAGGRQVKSGVGRLLNMDAPVKKRSAFHLFGVIGLLIIGEFWARYYAFCRFNAISPFNEFVHRYPLAFDGLLILMAAAILAVGVAAFSSKLWLSISLLALGTLLFMFSQIT